MYCTLQLLLFKSTAARRAPLPHRSKGWLRGAFQAIGAFEGRNSGYFSSSGRVAKMPAVDPFGSHHG